MPSSGAQPTQNPEEPYFPGNSSRVFRVTNVSQGANALDCSRGIVQFVFERVEREIECPFDGAFADEFDYRGVD